MDDINAYVDNLQPKIFLDQMSVLYNRKVILSSPKRNNGYIKCDVIFEDTGIFLGTYMIEPEGETFKRLTYDGIHPNIPSRERIVLSCTKLGDRVTRHDKWRSIIFPGIPGVKIDSFDYLEISLSK